MATTLSLTWSAHRYHGSKSPWVALVTGSDGHYGYTRQFLGQERTHSRSGATGDTTWTVGQPGLYECRFPRRRNDDGGWRIVWLSTTGLRWTTVTEERAKAIVALMDAGQSYDDARRATKPAAAGGAS